MAAILALGGYGGFLAGSVFKQLFIYAMAWGRWLVSAIPWVTIMVITTCVLCTIQNWRCPACRKAVTWRWDVSTCPHCRVALR